MKILKETTSYIFLILTVILIRTFIVTPVSVDGRSMYPTLNDNEILLLKKYDKTLERFDIVVFEYGGSKLIKRVIGLPGETVEYKDNELYINGKKINDVITDNNEDYSLQNLGVDIIPKDMYFVLGDNRLNSSDSRTIGLISIEDIDGTVTFRLLPFDRFGTIE